MFEWVFNETLDEKTLLEKAKTSEYYFGRLFDTYSPQVYRFVRRRVATDQDAEDIVSEVFMTVATKLGSYDLTMNTKFSSRLLGIANNKLLTYFRDEAPAYQEEVYGNEYIEHHTVEEDFAEIFTHKHVYETILHFVKGLAERQSAIFFLRFVEGYHNNEIAEMLNIHEKTVSSTVYVVCQKIQDHVREKEFVE